MPGVSIARTNTMTPVLGDVLPAGHRVIFRPMAPKGADPMFVLRIYRARGDSWMVDTIRGIQFLG
jgi:hypothetical protein